jgi:hypothetical protein
MKRLARTLVILLSLMGISMPVQANNGMTDMMRVMMEMFLWMMGGSGGMNPYRLGGMGGLNNPLLANSMLGNPMLGNSLLGGSAFGNPSGWGNSLPYNIQGLYSPPGYPGSAAYYNPYTSPYSNPYTSPNYGNAYGNQPYYRGDYRDPYYPNQYPRNSPYSSSYYPGPYNTHRPQAQYPDPSTPLVLQPIIVNTGEQDAVKPAAIATEPKFQPPVSSQTTAMAPAVTNYASNNQSRGVATPLSGRWQGVNGEYLELGEKRFRLRSNDTDLKGTYRLKNSILKAEIPDRKEPVYMQYKMSDGHLMFRSGDGQLMLFRRLPKSYRPH